MHGLAKPCLPCLYCRVVSKRPGRVPTERVIPRLPRQNYQAYTRLNSRETAQTRLAGPAVTDLAPSHTTRPTYTCRIAPYLPHPALPRAPRLDAFCLARPSRAEPAVWCQNAPGPNAPEDTSPASGLSRTRLACRVSRAAPMRTDPNCAHPSRVLRAMPAVPLVPHVS